MSPLIQFLLGFGITFIAMWFIMPLILFFIRLIGFYTIVQEGTCQVFILFGKVIGIISEPGLHILPFKIGFKAQNSGYALGSAVFTQQSGQLRRRRADGCWYLV
jgi:hypothetical protein